MNKMFILMCVMVFAVSAIFAGGHPVTTNQTVQITEPTRDDIIYWEEDFEDGQGDWTFVDETAPAEAWHLSTEGAYDGNSWWMGNEEIGGYTNHRYIVLDTPDITLPTGSPELTFQMAYFMEDIGGTTPYDAWDGFNVRISTDSGANWDVISGSPAYTATSFYSFGYEFNEGPDIPGYGGDSNGWVAATYSLSAYAGQDVMIRFAFASDPSACTDDGNGDPNWFGVRVDDINVAGVFESDGDGAAGDSQMVPGTLNEVAGNNWGMTTENAHSGTQSVRCEVGYDLLNAVVSPGVELPELDELYFAYWADADMLDSDGNDDSTLEDYFLVYVRPVGETEWTRLHYLFYGPDSGGLENEWSLVNEDFCSINLTYQTPAGTCDITEFAGQEVQFRVVVTTDDNDDGGIGDGLFLDDFMVYSPVFLPNPTDLTAEINDDYEVELNWENPMAGGGEGWIQWDSGENTGNSVGMNSAATVDVAARFDANDLLPYVTSSITTVKFFAGESTDFTIKIWESGSTELLSQTVGAVTADTWVEVDLDTPLTIDLGTELWIGYSAIDTGDGFYPCGCDDGPMVAGKGGWIRSDGGAWGELPETLDYNWNIQAYVTAPEGGRPLTRDLTGYKVFRSDESGVYTDPIVEITDPDQTNYTDTDPTEFAVNYYIVTAVYDEGDSQPSEEAMAFVLAESAVTYTYDDGDSDDGYQPASNTFAANYFDGWVHPDEDNVTLRYALIYFTAVEDWDAIIKVWDNDGTDGMPGTEIATFVYDNEAIIPNEWNYIEIADMPDFDDGQFYIGVMGVADSPTIGVDESISGWSYTTEDGDWAMVDGTFMIRAVVDTHNGEETNEIEPFAKLTASNYPNPFNPETTVRFNLPQAGQTEVKIYNLRGQLVKTLADDVMEAGKHEIVWRADDQASGVYFLRVNSTTGSLTQKMILLK